MKDFWVFFVVQFLQYFLVTINFRAAAQGLYGWTFLSDLLVAGNGYLIIQRVSKAEGRAAMAGYVLGGAFGSIGGIWITKVVYGQ